MKLTPWFPNSIKPVRVGVYEIRGSSRFYAPNFRRWNGRGWSATYREPNEHCQSNKVVMYRHGQDMTGWRGVKK